MRVLGIITALMVLGCTAQTSATNNNLPPLSKQFQCLPKEAAFLAAHRGTVKKTSYPENSMSGLEMLIKRGYLFAEIDIAGLKDGTHILFHDGVWEEKSAGQGAVAASTWDRVQSFLLKDTGGKLSSDTPPRLDDYLKAAEGKIYLEIDFKSSAKYNRVIDLIRENNMTDQVILISYNPRQTAALAKLAPDMMLSVSVGASNTLANIESASVKRHNIAAWLGNTLLDNLQADTLADMNIPLLGMMGRDMLKEKVSTADLLVTDYAFDYQPIIGLTPETRKAYELCLKRG